MEDRIEALLGQLTLEEKVSLVAGADMWTSPGVPRLSIPALKVTDGPNGARGGTVPGAGRPAACFPCGTALGATWNPDLVRRVGVALGEEARSKGAHVLLAPAVNAHRSPLAGRNFECHSEDPHLAARIAVAFVEGVQGQGVGTSVKHFVCNDSEFERHTIDSRVDERALREIYLPAFEAAVVEAGAWTVMGAYNRVNGTYACEHPRLLGDLLKGEWGFDGVVVSDWFATQSTADSANAGLDLEMPGPPRRFGEKLVEAVRAGEVAEKTIDEMVRRGLRLRLRTGAFDAEPAAERSVDRPEHRALARRAAAEATVLLRNDGLLPFDIRALRRIAVIGPNGDEPTIQGGGSCQVTPHYEVSPLDGLRRRCGKGVRVDFSRGCSRYRTMPSLDERLLADGDDPGKPIRLEFFDGPDPEGAPVAERRVRRLELTWFDAPVPEIGGRTFSVRATATLRPPETGTYRFSLSGVGPCRLLIDGREVVDNATRPEPGDSFFGQGSAEVSGTADLVESREATLVIEYAKTDAKPAVSGVKAGCLRPEPADLLERAVETATAADAAVVVVGLDREWETEGRDRDDMDLPGRQAELVERVAAANPNTVVVLNAGSALRMPWLPAVRAVLQLWYPGQECGNALADVLFGDAEPGGRLPCTFPRRVEDSPSQPWYPGSEGVAEYGEGVFVGYRHYDTKGVEPLFPFGHGLSYAEFSYGDLVVSDAELGAGETLEVRIDVTNRGERAGSQVVQLYVHDVEARLPRPEQELKAFAKLSLEPGETRTARFALDARALSFYDPDAGAWVAEPGDFELRAGASSRDLRSRKRVRLRD